MRNHGGMAVALVGATASGKSALAHELALANGDVEILSVDSMCVYRGMDIGTAKAITSASTKSARNSAARVPSRGEKMKVYAES